MSLDQSSPSLPASGPGAPGPSGAPSHPAPAAPPTGEMTTGQWVRLAVVLGLLVWLTASTGIYGLAMVLGIVVMIFLHELGHYVMAKRAGMKVTEFFLGFGPRIWSFQRGETEYGLKLIPAGAYVKIIGMHDIEEVDPADEPRTYRQQPFWQRFGVAVAGSTVHMLLALGLIYGLLVGFGVPGGSITRPDETRWEVGRVSADTAAEAAGLEVGDVLLAVDGTEVDSFDELRAEVSDRPDESVTLTVLRDGDEQEVEVTLGRSPADAAVGFLGVSGTVPVEKLGPVEAVPATFRELGIVSVESVKALGRFFTPSGISDFGRQVADAGDDGSASDEAPTSTTAPASSSSSSSSSASDAPDGENRLLSLLGVFRIGVDAGEGGGAAALVLLFAMINVFIGLFNMLPLLPFDGGHVVIAVYEKVQEWRKGLRTRYLADVSRLLPMTYAVVVVLGLIFVSTLYLDIANPLTVN